MHTGSTTLANITRDYGEGKAADMRGTLTCVNYFCFPSI